MGSRKEPFGSPFLSDFVTVLMIFTHPSLLMVMTVILYLRPFH